MTELTEVVERRRRWPRRLAVGAAALVVVAACVGWYALSPDAARSGQSLDRSHLVSATVTRQDLVVGDRVAGELGFGVASPLVLRATGTVTSLPRTGARLSRGEIVLRVDDRPVVLLYGRTPAYRAMHLRTAVGPDVEQLERGLRQLGYGGFTVDDDFTEATAAAVKAWQASLGMPATGRVELGDVVFTRGPIRVRPDSSQLGREVTDSAVLAQGTRRVVTVQGTQDELDWAVAGARVTVGLADGRDVRGRVASIGSSGGGGEASSALAAEIRLAKRVKASPGPVTVTHVVARRRAVLTVPVMALVALAEGGYAVQLDSGAYAAVEVGLYADGQIEVSGPDVDAGTKILVPQ